MDQQLFHLINERWTNPALDLFMAAISDADVWKPLLIIIIFAALVFGGFRARACIFCLLIGIVIAEPVTNTLKSAINRRRPKHVDSVRMVKLEKGRPEFMSIFKKPVVRRSDESDKKRGDPSFPSGHMVNNTIAGICLTIFYRRGCRRDSVSRGRRNFFCSGGARITLALARPEMDAANLRAPSRFDPQSSGMSKTSAVWLFIGAITVVRL
jgi:membrane-associated phospholipid phosphatase